MIERMKEKSTSVLISGNKQGKIVTLASCRKREETAKSSLETDAFSSSHVYH
jgi:hypothetical protein